MRRAQVLASRGREKEIEPLVAWYQSQPVNRIAPLPVRR
jgi:hypothetical protein